jgi:hypothetical protein
MKNKQIISSGFSAFYNYSFLNILNSFQLVLVNLKLNNLLLNNNISKKINNFLFSTTIINNIKKLNSIKIDEI